MLKLFLFLCSYIILHGHVYWAVINQSDLRSRQSCFTACMRTSSPCQAEDLLWVSAAGVNSAPMEASGATAEASGSFGSGPKGLGCQGRAGSQGKAAASPGAAYSKRVRESEGVRYHSWHCNLEVRALSHCLSLMLSSKALCIMSGTLIHAESQDNCCIRHTGMTE